MGALSVSAKTPAKKSAAKPQSTQTLPMKTTPEGYPAVLGHTYSCKLSDGSTWKFVFKANGVCTVTMSMGGKSQTANGYWDQSYASVSVYDEYYQEMVALEVEEGGKVLYGYSVYGEEYLCKLVK